MASSYRLGVVWKLFGRTVSLKPQIKEKNVPKNLENLAPNNSGKKDFPSKGVIKKVIYVIKKLQSDLWDSFVFLMILGNIIFVFMCYFWVIYGMVLFPNDLGEY